ncbi:MAG: hypothetical protein WBR18_10085 [Anaerolineales bacterium]
MTFDLGNVLQIATLVTVIAGLVFGVLEIRRASKARADKGALDVLGVAVDPDHIEASYAILELPEAAKPELVAQDPDLRRASNTLMVKYEYLGNLVYQRIVPLETLDLLVGGIIRASWKRLRPYIEAQRIEKDLPNMAEWFQWLAERLEEYGRPEKSIGTHVAFKDWEP